MHTRSQDDFPVSSSYESYLQRNIDMLAEYRNPYLEFLGSTAEDFELQAN